MTIAPTLQSELDPSNPSPDSLWALLTRRRTLIERYTSSDGAVREVEREIADRLARLARDTALGEIGA